MAEAKIRGISNDGYVDSTRTPTHTMELNCGIAAETVRDSNNVQHERQMIEWERALLDRERLLLARERELLNTSMASSMTVPHGTGGYRVQPKDVADIVPTFDPARTTSLTAEQWINRVNAIAGAYQWDGMTTVVHAASKLRGAAKIWYDNSAECWTEWGEFSEAFVNGFPSSKNEADIHMELCRRKKKTSETMEEYFYDVVAIARKANLSDNAVNKYIITGLSDPELCNALAVFTDDKPQQLLKRLKQHEDIMRQEKNRGQENKMARRTSTPARNAYPKCFKCGTEGHLAADCNSQRKRKCYTCQKWGHISTECPDKRDDKKPTTEKSVKRVEDTTQKPADGYYKKIQIEGRDLIAFIDLGSDCVTIREDAVTRFGIRYLPKSVNLKGFGGGRCTALGKKTMLIEIGEVKFETEVTIVPSEAQEDDLIIGRSMLDDPRVTFTGCGGKLQIKLNETQAADEIDTHSKVMRVRQEITEDQIVVNEELDDTHKQRLRNLINQNRDCFAVDLKELGTAREVAMKIELKDDKPVCYKPYRIPYAERTIMKAMIGELEASKIIQRSQSEYASPALLVNKANGEKRLCIDYRKLNAKTKKNKFPMVAMDELLDQLSGNRYFTVLDMASGYYQVKVDEDSRQHTAFVTTEGHYEFLKMPFGLVNAPAEFNQVMKKVEALVKPGDVIIYMDDVLSASSTIEEGIEKLGRILEAVRKIGLTLKIPKCKFLLDRIEFIGYEIDRGGVRPGKRKTQAIENYGAVRKRRRWIPTPTKENETTAADPERRIRTRSQTAAQQDRGRSRCQEGPNVNQKRKT